MRWGSSLLGASAVAVLVVACAASSDDVGETDGAFTAASSGTVSLLYEGTCEFLHNCSSFSRKLPVGQVQFGCEGARQCLDSDLWVAGPTHGHCGKHVKFCAGSKCTNALVRDVSVSHNWEASNGVLDALGLKHALTGKCSGNGGGKVTVTFPVPADPVPPKPPKTSAATAPIDAGIDAAIEVEPEKTEADDAGSP